MSTTPDTTTSGGLANADHQASDKGKVASRIPWRRRNQKLKPVSTTIEKVKFEGNCDVLSGYIYDCADLKQAADMYMSTTKEISEYVGRTYKYRGDMRQVIRCLRPSDMAGPADTTRKTGNYTIGSKMTQ